MKDQRERLPPVRPPDHIDRFGPETSVSALAAGCCEEELAFLRGVFRDAEWILHEAPTLTAALIVLNGRPIDTVIANRDLPDGCWRVLLAAMEPLAAPPPLIVTSRFADERLWVEVLNEGGYDVLAQPFHREEVIRVVSAGARRNRNAQARRATISSRR